MAAANDISDPPSEAPRAPPTNGTPAAAGRPATFPHRTPVPSDWEHAKILIGRTFRKDRQKPKLYFAKFFLFPILVMLYNIGFLIGDGGASEDQSSNSVIAGGFELYDGTTWEYPASIHLAGAVDEDLVTMVGEAMDQHFNTDGKGGNSVNVEWSSSSSSPPDNIEDNNNSNNNNNTTNNRTEFLDGCQSTIGSAPASQEVCVYLDAMDNYTIFYGGDETASPYQSALAGAQWAVNAALLAVAAATSNDTVNTTTTDEESSPPALLFPVTQIQRIPRKISEGDSEPMLLFLLLPAVMHVLACAIGTQFMVGPITYEKINHVTESFLFVGVNLRTYLFQWIGYFSINLISTAILLTVVAEYWNLMPMSDSSLVGISSYLGCVQLMSHFTLIMQFITQEELAQGLPFLSGLLSIGIGSGLLWAGWETSALMYILSVLSPFVGMMQYYGIYITYDYAGYDIGIHWGQNVVESGLLGSFIAQLVGIALYWGLCCLYASESFNDWISGSSSKKKIEQEEDQQPDPSLATTSAANATPQGNTSSLSGDDFQPLPPGSDVVVRVRGVEHTYRPGRFLPCGGNPAQQETEVLKGLDMDICRGEVFGYLGHNGAGKTTSVKILADQLKLQRGSVSYHFRDGDYDLTSGKDIHKIRNKIGVCPQHNTSLQDDLTARETLRLFAHLKGGIAQDVSAGQSISDAVEAEVERRLADVKFTTVGDSEKPVGTFSGGMKRKVLIAMSLLGDPEVVFLDEPTAGLDPYNRRSIWDMIVEAKQGRSIILTTHFLDEADVLSDRVGIIKNGSLITCGSSLFLKHAFGVGYTLTFDAPSPISINTMIPQAEAVTREQPAVTGTMSQQQWRLGHGAEGSFPEALKTLQRQGASNIQLDLTTLEQVFLETGKEDIDDDNDEPGEEDSNGNNNETMEATDGVGPDRNGELLSRIWEPRCEIKAVSWWTKLYLVQNFMMVNAWKIKGAIMLNVGMPLIYLIAGVTLAAFFESDVEGETITNDAIGISPVLAGPARFFGVPMLGNFNPIQPLIPTDPPNTIEDYYQTGELPFLGGYFEGNSTLQYASELTPFSLQVATTVISNYSVWLNPNSTIDGISTSVQQLPYIAGAPFRVDVLFIPFCLSFGFAGLAFSVLDVLLLKGDNSIGLFRVSGITEWTTYLGVMMYKLTTTFLPFLTALVVLGFSVGLVLFGNAGRWLGSLLLMFTYGYSLTPMGLILAKRFIHSDYKSVSNWFPGVYFTFSGVPWIAYSSLLQALPDAEHAILILGDVLCVVPQFAFQRGLGAILAVSSDAADNELTWGDVWSFDTRLWFTLLMMSVVGTLEWYYLYRLTTTREARTTLSQKDDPDLTTPLDVSQDPAMVEERGRSRADSNGINARDVVKVFKVKDKSEGKKGSFKIKEAVKGISFGIRKNEILALLGPNGAGKTVTMSVLAGEITPEHGEVALNGVQVQNTDRSVDPLFADCDVAYVPQFDALFPKQSVEEHLKFYSRIRGLDWENAATQEHVNAIVKLLGLEKHLPKNSGELSGGYKRRLSLAVALIGYPEAMMLDEVTTGLDPGARRLIWDVLKPKQQLQDIEGQQHLARSFDIPAILLSTHYMEESEALGDRIGIMIDGRFAAIGSLSQLYDRYCTSFFIELSLDPAHSHTSDHENEMDQKILDTFEDAGMPASIYEQLPYHLKLQVPFTDDIITNVGGSGGSGSDKTIHQLADLFDLLEAHKEVLHIQFYSVAKMNLEQIFIDLSRQQLDATAELEDTNQ